MKKAFFLGVLLITVTVIAECNENTYQPEITGQVHSTFDELVNGFQMPPNASKPGVWWHWMNGNVSIEGIDQDLKWMKRAGIGHVHHFDGSMESPRLVSEPLVYRSESWNRAFAHAVTKAQELDLEFTIASSPGWSQTGGPWVEPDQAMKKLVWSETVIEGGGRVKRPLPIPPSIAGPYQDIPVYKPGNHGVGHENIPPLYRDSITVGYRLPDIEHKVDIPTISASSDIETENLADGDFVQPINLPFDGKKSAWVKYSYDEPVTKRAVTLALEMGPRVGPIPPSWPEGVVESSNDGVDFRHVVDLPQGGNHVQTLSFPAVTARHFRVRLFPRFAPGFFPSYDRNPESVAEHQIMEIDFISGARVHRFQDKAGWTIPPKANFIAVKPVDDESTIPAADVIDLSELLSASGMLDWNAPPGKWKILRMGWSLTGRTNGPASAEATGLEVDKYNRDHVRTYIEHYLDMYEEIVGPELMGEGINYLLNDSYESLSSNWTDDLLLEFRKRRGYEATPWLPVLAGAVVDSAEASEKFIWDFRRTLSDLIVEVHYEEISRSLQNRGMGRYGESHEGLRAFVGDGMEVKKSTSVPMGAQWTGQDFTWSPDLLESASVAHLYGQNIVAAESFTTLGNAYQFAPADLKETADRMMVNGVNRFFVHTSVHQPLEKAGPGFGLGPFGQWFTRKETWAEQAHAWVSYLARSSYLLQQGRFVADIAWFYGETTNISDLYYGRDLPTGPDGFRYDFVNADAIKNLLVVENGVLTSPGGAQYKMLVIDPAVDQITLPTLKKIAQFVNEGMIIVGVKPVGSPSLEDSPDEVTRLIQQIWSDTVARANVFASVEGAIQSLDIPADVVFKDKDSLLYLHRSLTNQDIYFIANVSGNDVDTLANFSLTGRQPVVFDAKTGRQNPIAYQYDEKGTEIPIRLAKGDSTFIVFGDHTERSKFEPKIEVVEMAMPLEGAWHVAFQAGRGAPSSVEFTTLRSWIEHDNPGVKYFSGSAIYKKKFSLDHKVLEDLSNVVLDLGSVKNIAHVHVNGKSAGIAWTTPFQVEIMDLVHPGENLLEITVTNLWPNRLIGDLQDGNVEPYAFAVFNPYYSDSPLLESGLIGPVRVLGMVAH